MKRVIIIGCPGAGKSTFARKLRDKTGFPLYHLDMIWHKPDKTTIEKSEFDEKLTELVKEESWIIDGNYQRTLDIRFSRCDTAFLLDFPLSVCLEGAGRRIGTKREDLPWIEEEFDPEFRQWIIDFHRDRLPGLYEFVRKYEDKVNIIVFKSREEVDEYFKRMDYFSDFETINFAQIKWVTPEGITLTDGRILNFESCSENYIRCSGQDKERCVGTADYSDFCVSIYAEKLMIFDFKIKIKGLQYHTAEVFGRFIDFQNAIAKNGYSLKDNLPMM